MTILKIMPYITIIQITNCTITKTMHGCDIWDISREGKKLKPIFFQSEMNVVNDLRIPY